MDQSLADSHQPTINASAVFWECNTTEQQLRVAKYGALHFIILALSQKGQSSVCETFGGWPGFDG